jgi:putative Mn2+ efflux pump MntP
MVVGVGYGLRPDMGVLEVLFSVVMIGVITFGLSALGVKIGNVFGDKYEKKAQLAGGIVLCLLGIKNVLDQYGVLDMAWSWVSGLFQ